MITHGLFSSQSDDWETPQEFFDQWDEIYHFDLDVCATASNAKCKRFYTPEQNGLIQSWQGNVWMNPPYGKQIGKWMGKAYSERMKCNVIVCLVPARTDTKWFHDYVYGKADLRFLKGRLKFSGSKNSAPFPSMMAIYRNV